MRIAYKVLRNSNSSAVAYWMKRGTLLLLLSMTTGCADLPQAWTDDETPEYQQAENDRLLEEPGPLPIVIEGAVPGVAASHLRRLVIAGMTAATSWSGSAERAKLEPTSPTKSGDSAESRIVWAFETTAADGGQASEIRAAAKLMRDGALLTSAEGRVTLDRADGRRDEALSQLVSDVTRALFPQPLTPDEGAG